MWDSLAPKVSHSGNSDPATYSPGRITSVLSQYSALKYLILHAWYLQFAVKTLEGLTNNHLVRIELACQKSEAKPSYLFKSIAVDARISEVSPSG